MQADGDVESNPGPSSVVVVKNVRGLQSGDRLQHFMRAVKAKSEQMKIQGRKLAAVMIQEHNLKREEEHVHKQQARYQRMTWIGSYHPEAKLGSGTAIIIPWDNLELKKDEKGKLEEPDVAGRRVAATGETKITHDGRITTCNILLGGKDVQLVAAYAPVESKERPNFFNKELEPIMSINSLLGIDANCVPNAIEDYRSDSGATPPNKGASELLEIINSYELEDAKVTTYGHDQPIYTSHHVTKVGPDGKPIEVCKTRIDQILSLIHI